MSSNNQRQLMIRDKTTLREVRGANYCYLTVSNNNFGM